MLGGLFVGVVPCMPSVWTKWIDHIMAKKADLGFRKAALVQFNGITAAATSGFFLDRRDVQILDVVFSNNNNVAQLRLKGSTYIVKVAENDQLIAFNGSKYLIVCRTSTMYMVTICGSRSQSKEAADWLLKLSRKLVQKKF